MNCNTKTILMACMLLGSLISYSQDRPNFVWLVSEDNSKHYMSMYDRTGVDVPNIEGLAENGLIFNNAFSNSPACSSARSTLISGVYGPRVASHYHRKLTRVNMPFGLKMFPRYLANAGYHTSNGSKTDFNINNTSPWSGGSSNNNGWRDRSDGQPFFHFFNTMSSHESLMHFSNTNESVPFDMDTIFVDPRHPDTELFRYAGAFYRKKITEMDDVMGRVINSLKEDGLYDDTFIFYFGDHGGVLPGSKGSNHETGLHVPLVVHIPKNFEHLVDFEPGTRVDGFVSFVDFGATVLNLAGVDIPEELDGVPFLGSNVTAEEVNDRNTTFSYADRFGECMYFVRSVRRGRYKYTRNYQPFIHQGIYSVYRFQQLAYKEWRELYDKGELNEVQASFFEPKLVEELYDIENDPYETVNLANDPSYSSTVTELRGLLRDYQEESKDLSFYPEFHLVNKAFPNTGSFGVSNASRLEELMDVADLQLLDFSTAESGIASALESDNQWHRYWALIVCSSFGLEAADFTSQIRDMSNDDNETTVNRFRALEFLALTEAADPAILAAELVQNMYQATSVAECLLYLNTMAMLKESRGYMFEIDRSQISKSIRSNFSVGARVDYLYSVPNATQSNLIPTGRYDLLSVDSEETDSQFGHAKNAFDDNPTTYWLTQERGGALPHEIIFALDSLYSVNGFRYLPRRDGSKNGTIAGYEIYVSDRLYDIRDPENRVASGAWAADNSPKDVFFDGGEAKFIRLVALSDVSGRGLTSASELRVFGDATGRLGDISTILPDGTVGEGVTTATYQIMNRKSRKCLVNGGGDTTTGTPIVQVSCDGNSDQQHWEVTKLEGGEFVFEHVSTGLVSDISGRSLEEGTENILWTDTGGDNQRWNLVEQEGDYYHIVNVNSDLILDISRGSRRNGAPSIQWEDNGGRNQDWYFMPVESSSGSRTIAARLPQEELKELTTAQQFVVYPNPIGGEGGLNVQVPEGYLEGKLTVINYAGEVLLTEQATATSMSLDVSGLGTGIYLLRISNGHTVEVRKLIIE